MVKTLKLEAFTAALLLIGIIILVLSKFNILPGLALTVYPLSILTGVILAFINSYVKAQTGLDKLTSWLIALPILIVLIFKVFFLPGYESIDIILAAAIVGFAIKIIVGRKVYLYEPIFVFDALTRLI